MKVSLTEIAESDCDRGPDKEKTDQEGPGTENDRQDKAASMSSIALHESSLGQTALALGEEQWGIHQYLNNRSITNEVIAFQTKSEGTTEKTTYAEMTFHG